MDSQTPQSPKTEIFQLVDDSGNLSNKEDIQLFLDKRNFNTYGKKYNIISIIGGQSSGKSTLLNYLFNTSFEELNSKQRRTQTTKGIWIAQDLEKPLIVMDVEGSDSLQRGDEMTAFQTSTALFALALSQIFIVNIWCHDIGRFTGQQIGTLRTIFEMNIKLFKRDQLKNIIFVIRDFSYEDENFDYIRAQIINDIEEHVWNNIHKPEEMREMKPDQLFKISVFPMSHFKLQQKQFKEDANRLRRTLTDDSYDQYILKNFDYNLNLPAEALVDFAQSVWDQIKQSKDINLPNQKILVSTIRCTQIEQESIKLVQEDFKQLRQKVNSSYYPEFQAKANQIIQKVFDYYNTHSQDYVKEVVDERRKELENALRPEVIDLFDENLKKLRDLLKDKFKNSLVKLKLDQQNYQNVKKVITEKTNEVQKEFDNALSDDQLQTLNVLGIQNFKIEQLKQEFQEYLSDQSDAYLQTCLSEFLKKENKLVRQKIKELVKDNYKNLNSDIWNNLKSSIQELKQKFIKNYQEKMANDFGFNEEFISEEISKFQRDYYLETFHELKSQAQEIYIQLLEKFKSGFERQNGVPRNWTRSNEEEINSLYVKNKEEIDQMFNSFNQNSFLYIQPEDYDISKSIMFDTEDELKLLNNNEKEQILKRYSDEIDKVYRNAIREYQSLSQGGIPKIFWIVLIYFMYDDVFRWLGNWYLFLPISFIAIFLGFAVALGYKDLPKMIFNQIYQFLIDKGIVRQVMDQAFRILK